MCEGGKVQFLKLPRFMLNRNFMLQNHSVKWYKYNRGDWHEPCGMSQRSCEDGF